MEIIKIIASEDVADNSSHKLLTGTGRLNEEIAARPLYQQVGFTSLPKAGTRHVGILDGNQVTIIASTDTEDDRPVLSNTSDCAVYASKTVYIKVETGGDITIESDGDVQINANSGKVVINNSIEDFASLMSDLIDEIIAIITLGSSTTQVLDPATIALFQALKVRMALLLKES